VSLLFVALPYAAVAVFIAGVILRFRSEATISSQSSQILESRVLAWGSIPFHAGVFTLFFFHLIPLVIPNAWRSFAAANVIAVESIALAAAMLCLFGLIVLLIRRIGSGSVRAGSRPTDIVILLVLIAQVATGIVVATLHRWGAVWSVGTTVPYLRSLIVFRPDPSYVAGIPKIVMWHLSGAWVVLGLLPFTRLIHMLAIPLMYLRRPPQKVVWMARRPVAD
jgi:nitrate reductase gamma subunit